MHITQYVFPYLHQNCITNMGSHYMHISHCLSVVFYPILYQGRLPGLLVMPLQEFHMCSRNLIQEYR